MVWECFAVVWEDFGRLHGVDAWDGNVGVGVDRRREVVVGSGSVHHDYGEEGQTSTSLPRSNGCSTRDSKAVARSRSAPRFWISTSLRRKNPEHHPRARRALDAGARNTHTYYYTCRMALHFRRK